MRLSCRISHFLRDVYGLCVSVEASQDVLEIMFEVLESPNEVVADQILSEDVRLRIVMTVPPGPISASG